MANPARTVVMFGSDGSQQEGNDAEAARLAVAQGLDVKLLIDDNDVTIAGHPSEYLGGFDVKRTLEGHGLRVEVAAGEDVPGLHQAIAGIMAERGPAALVIRRKMAPGIAQLEGRTKGHDVIPTDTAIAYLQDRGQDGAVAYLRELKPGSRPKSYRGSATTWGKNREVFGDAVCEQLGKLSPKERVDRVKVFDSDLEGSCGLAVIGKTHPEVYVRGGIMERGNFSAAAGFGMEPQRQGIMATFSAFLEMVISEISMARLNECRVLGHFSHAGVDDMADNTCHFGVNNFFADNGLSEGDHTRLYFPADQHQMRAVIASVFDDPGLRFVFSTRSPVPDLLDSAGEPLYGASSYRFEPGKDEVIREGSAGYVVSYGEMLFRSLDAVEQLRADGLDVGLVAKPTLNVVDEAMMQRLGSAPFVLVVESQNRTTGLGMRFGSWLLERGFGPRYAYLGSTRIGIGGLWEQISHQGLDPQNIVEKVRSLVK